MMTFPNTERKSVVGTPAEGQMVAPWGLELSYDDIVLAIPDVHDDGSVTITRKVLSFAEFFELREAVDDIYHTLHPKEESAE